MSAAGMRPDLSPQRQRALLEGLRAAWNNVHAAACSVDSALYLEAAEISILQGVENELLRVILAMRQRL